MLECTWIASFPKSGNTWVRYILAQLLYDFDLETSRIDATIPDLNNWEGDLTHQYNGAFTIKTHLKYDELPAQMKTRNAIYIVRHPGDVFVSILGYMAPNKDPDLLAEIHEQFFDENGSFPSWHELRFGGIVENVMSWSEAAEAGEDILFVRYEDILANTVSEIQRMAAFLGCDADESRCRVVAERTQFDNMRSLEEQQIAEQRNDMFLLEHGYKDGDPNFRFMRSGKSGEYHDTLAPATIQRLRELCVPILERFNYDM